MTLVRLLSALLLVVTAFACNDATLTATTTPPPGPDDKGDPEDAGSETVAHTSDSGASRSDGGSPSGGSVRIMAANISSGTNSNYDAGEGIRIFKGLHPDVVLIQEFNYKTNSSADIEAFVAETFGPDFAYYREDGLKIPNGVISRYPILTSGRWTDPRVADRGFAYAKIDIPGPHDLWAVSVHLLTSSSTARAPEATALVAELDNVVGADDYVVIGGDFNTKVRDEPCITTLGKVVDVTAGLPVDQQDNDFTNEPRTAPYDWVLASASLGAFQVPTVIGSKAFPHGLVFDSRVYTPLSDIAPVMLSDSSAEGMQHMPVVKDFAFEQ
jgi:endonuclease/exonuclease/phosphatase family metal-dependent hydrolase